MAMYHNGQVQTTTTFGNTQHQLDRDTLTPTQQREQELEEFYAHQQKAMDKRLEMVFRQINNQRENPAAWGRGASMRNMGPLANSEDEAAREKEKVKGDKIDVDELEECLLRLCKMTAKQVDGCSRGPADLPVKPLDQVPYIQDMIWEIDESGDGVVTMHEFKKCYQRAAADETGFEPRKLATLIDFLLMDEEFLGFVTEDQIIELMTARYGYLRDDPQVVCMVSKNSDLAAKAQHISYPEFVRRMAKSLRICRKKHGLRKDSYLGDGCD